MAQYREDRRGLLDGVVWITTIPGVQSIVYLALGVYIGALLFDGGGVQPTESGYAVNLFTEVMGIAVTVVIIERIARRRADVERRHLLSAQLTSSSDVVALLAWEELHARGWLSLDKLERANLSGVNLSGMALANANLKSARLRDVALFRADLRDADLSWADLTAARLVGSDLRGASLRNTILSGATLNGVKLDDADLIGVTCDETTVLPDGSNWSPDVDWSRFTNAK